jgi:hypothetical protein
MEEICIWKMEAGSEGGQYTQLWSKCSIKTTSGDARIIWFDIYQRAVWTNSTSGINGVFVISVAYSNSIIKVRYTENLCMI